jgi:pyruvate formate lyase activating enzyme
VHVDPIEKKPFYHFLPGASAFSLATAGCPFHCAFCQNWEISRAKPEAFDGPYVPPDQIAGAAAGRNVPVIAYTYNEPTVFFEYMVDIARAAREKGIKNVLVSCGFMNAEPLSELCAVLDAIKIDLKGITPEFYRDVCDARLGPVLSSIRQIAKSGVHLEIVNLVVPTLNDAEASLTELCKWVASEIGTDVPLHFTRFHPDYRLRNLPPTPVSTLEAAYDIAKAQGIRYPFVGNVPGHPGNHTLCPECGKAVLKRSGFFLTENHITNGRCDFCGASIAGVWR